MATALLMVPLALLLSMVVPGNKVLPVADLAILPSMVAFLVGPSRGNLLRSIIVSCLVVPLFLLISTDLAGIHSTIARVAGMDFPAGISTISSLYVGTFGVPWLILKALTLLFS